MFFVHQERIIIWGLKAFLTGASLNCVPEIERTTQIKDIKF